MNRLSDCELYESSDRHIYIYIIERKVKKDTVRK
jgi:hypothetical protein